jgi:uncharacterized membrane protein YGL010W
VRRVDEFFSEYESFHKDPRNKLCHYVGITTIVLSVAAALDLVALPGAPELGAWGPLTLAFPAVLLLALFYLSLDVALGFGAALVLFGFAFAGKYCGGWPGALGLFVGGWILQFVGHYFEGKRPAFLRNGVHLLVGPLWILSHVYEVVGLRSKQAAPSSL